MQQQETHRALWNKNCWFNIRTSEIVDVLRQAIIISVWSALTWSPCARMCIASRHFSLCRLWRGCFESGVLAFDYANIAIIRGEQDKQKSSCNTDPWAMLAITLIARSLWTFFFLAEEKWWRNSLLYRLTKVWLSYLFTIYLYLWHIISKVFHAIPLVIWIVLYGIQNFDNQIIDLSYRNGCLEQFNILYFQLN